MKYLLYYLNGFIKKFPLNQSSLTVGRSSENEITIEDEFLSRKHILIQVENDFIKIKDRNSLNGSYVNQKRIDQAIIKVGGSFIIGGIEFFLKKGTMDEFQPAKELIPIFNHLHMDNKQRFQEGETKYIKNIYNETLKHILKTGLSKNSFNDLLLELSSHMLNIIDSGSLFLISDNKKRLNILLSIKNDPMNLDVLKKIAADFPNIFKENFSGQYTAENANVFYSFAFKIKTNNSALVYICPPKQKNINPKLENFLSALAKEIALFTQLITEEKLDKKETNKYLIQPTNFIVANKRMKEIIKQATIIAKSDMFVLIQGESGTGKELLAKLIHKHSRRSRKKAIGINCAAIPETLLESELFGYEKGAFTGAYAQKQGKLEITSGSTLILDEIGDMPLSLQPKLLRALQEKEFYRLGGTSPVKVDLRVISTTNKNLKQLIQENKFREDLFYRLVHRTICIPPLRERKEDISLLINYFTNKFCQISNKTINGYSVKAFETLLNFTWKGNIRQLENEINSIVNLTDNGEMITFDILSDEIKYNVEDYFKTSEFNYTKTTTEDEKEVIIKLLRKNNLNKSKTARELRMTYQGLHKKMKRLNIDLKE